VAAVALPAVRGPVRRHAADEVAAATLGALTAATYVVDGDAVADRQPTSAWAERGHHTGGLVSGDDVLVGLRAGAEMLAIDGAHIAAANGRRAHREQHLPRAGLGHGHVAQDGASPTRQVDATHRRCAHSGSVTG
jgi:hypothetical protein